MISSSKTLRTGALTAALLLALASPWAQTAQTPHSAQGTNAASAAPLTLEQIYRARPYRGEAAKDAAFSKSGRYLAYLWNPQGEPGFDLWVHDTRTQQTQRISSRAAMAAFDGPEELAAFDRKRAQRDREWQEAQAREEAQQAYLRGETVDLKQWERAALERLKAEAAARKARQDAEKAADKVEAEAEKRAMAELAARRAGKPLPPTPAASAAPAAPTAAPAAAETKKEDWEWRDELKKQRELHKLKPADLYPGVAQFVWAHEADELIFQYRGNLLRWRPQAGVEPLLLTQRTLRVLAYSRDDQGFLYQDETRVLRARFDRVGAQVLNRELVHPVEAERKYRIEATTLSEDGRFMALLARAPLQAEEGRSPPRPGRQVEIADYSKRWATTKKVDREVSDDKRMVLPLALYVRAVPQPGALPAEQGEPVFTHKGGDVWFEISPIAWTKNGSHYAFVTWEREKELLRVYLGTPAAAKPELVLERRGDVGHEVVNVLRPRFTPDGRQLVLTLDEAGFRQPYAIDLASRQLRPLLKGDFEAHTVLGFTPDSRAFFVLANQGDFGAMNLWRADMASGALTPIGEAGLYHRNAAVSHDGRWAAAWAGDWTRTPELRLLGGAAPRTLTQSHDPAWGEVIRLRPERFSFKNRHGDTLHAYAFKPPGWQASDRRPAVVYVYGGPLNDRHIVETDSFQGTGFLFNQYLALRHGYVTVSIDTRGHSNYGRRFSGANWERVGEPQTEDLEDLHRELVARWGVDGARVGLNGWSFGGFQTQHTLFTKPDLFAAGIAGAGPTEWENYNSWYSGRTIGKVDRSKPNLRKYSLLPLAANLKKPLLLVHGMADPNVLYQDTVNVYRALLESGKDALVDLYLDPEGEHAMGGSVKPVGLHRKYEAFWLRTLGRAQP